MSDECEYCNPFYASDIGLARAALEGPYKCKHEHPKEEIVIEEREVG